MGKHPTRRQDSCLFWDFNDASVARCPSLSGQLALQRDGFRTEPLADRAPGFDSGGGGRAGPVGRARAGSRCGVGGARASSAAMACVCGSGLAWRHGLEAARGRRQAPCPAQHRACAFSSRGGAGDGALLRTGPGGGGGGHRGRPRADRGQEPPQVHAFCGGGGVLATPSSRVRDGPTRPSHGPEGRGSEGRGSRSAYALLSGPAAGL
jgi:hypothetical protein